MSHVPVCYLQQRLSGASAIPDQPALMATQTKSNARGGGALAHNKNKLQRRTSPPANRKEGTRAPDENNNSSNNNNNKNNNENNLRTDNEEHQRAAGACGERYSGLEFKYRKNAAPADIEALRELLREERRVQVKLGQTSAEELAFYATDYERMMLDDWLVTRFLLRAKKALSREQDEAPPPCAEFESDGAGATRAMLERTLELIRMCARFRFEYRINDKTKVAEFPRDWTRVEGLLHHKRDRAGNPAAYLRVALHRPKLIEAPGARHQFKRYLLHLLELCDRELRNRPGKAICCVFDMTNAGFENMDLELTTWMIKSLKSCSPKLICYVIIYNPPWFFTATFKVICNTLLSNSKRQSVKFACGDEILDYISFDNLPAYIQSTIQKNSSSSSSSNSCN